MRYEDKIEEIAVVLYYNAPIWLGDGEDAEIVPWSDMTDAFKQRIRADVRVVLGCVIKPGPAQRRCDGSWPIRYSGLLGEWRSDNPLCTDDPWWADLPQPPRSEGGK